MTYVSVTGTQAYTLSTDKWRVSDDVYKARFWVKYAGPVYQGVFPINPDPPKPKENELGEICP